MWLKGVVLRAHYNGKIPRNPFAQFHISPNCKEREFLTEDELKAVVTHEFEDDNLAFVRDIFVFVCFTALLFIDVKELTTDNIVDINGDKWIIGHRHKTGIHFQVKLMDVPLQIVDRYTHLQEDKLVFGKMNYWSMCKKLKKVMEAYCPMSLLNLDVRHLPLRHWGHKGVVGYPYCGINPHGWD
jgi:hypothetical protein